MNDGDDGRNEQNPEDGEDEGDGHRGTSTPITRAPGMI
jgi:hypothetical protein